MADLTDSPSPQSSPEATQRIIELTLPDHEHCVSRWDALDSKAWQGLTTAAVALTLGMGIGSPDLEVTAAGISSFSICAAAAAYTVWPRYLRHPINSAELWSHAWAWDVNKIDLMVVDEIEEAAIENANRLRSKALGLRVTTALMFVCVVVAMVAATET